MHAENVHGSWTAKINELANVEEIKHEIVLNFQQNRKANLEALDDVQVGHETRRSYAGACEA